MNKLSNFLEKFLMPVAAFIGGQKHLGAMRDGFIATLVINMTGAMAVLFNNLIFTNTSLIGRELNKNAGYAESVQPVLNEYFVPVMGRIWWATLAIISILLVITISYSLAKSYEVDGISAALVATSSYFALLPEGMDVTGGASGILFKAAKGKEAIAATLVDSTNAAIQAAASNPDLVAEATIGNAWGQITVGSFGSNAMFSAIIVGLIAAQLFVIITKAGWTFKMPEQVPPAVSKAFSAIIPGFITIALFSTVGFIFTNIVKTPFNDVIFEFIQKPLVAFGQSPISYMVLVMIAQLLWFFGLHGSNIIDPVMNTMYKPPLLENIEVYAAGGDPVHTLTRNFLDVYAMHGGSGATLALLIAIFFFSKKQEERELFKIAIAPGLFQINEPVIFGLPMVLNAKMFLPFVFLPPVCIGIAYFFTEIGFAAKIAVETPWVTPPILGAFMATGFDWKAAVVAAGTFALSIAVYIPFIIAGNKDEA
ncbi:PTS sugar transporter subunit IIC [uncultured Clostridium sp.]|uniref:PTS sugar transporter subunit IIC n=1 Tax=uncultured Clostridium sp. TaxID=59620 RepID=UPI00261BF9AA|nr:PTS transporter subunit EIIC [uncultured Clostridium sp.]